MKAAAGELSQEGFDGSPPYEGFEILIPSLEELCNSGDQVGHAGERVATDTLGGEFSRPALDEVEPAATGGHEVNHETRMPGGNYYHAASGCSLAGFCQVLKLTILADRQI